MQFPSRSSFTLGPWDVVGVPAGDSIASVALFCKTAAQSVLNTDTDYTWTLAGTVEDDGSGASDPEQKGTGRISFAVTSTQTSSNTIGTTYYLALKITFTGGGVYRPLDVPNPFVVVDA